MMSGMLAALTPSTGIGPKNPDLREHCERLVVQLQDPYLRTILTHLTVNGDWTEVLEEDSLSLRERLAIALLFLSDKEFTPHQRSYTLHLSFSGVTAHQQCLSATQSPSYKNSLKARRRLPGRMSCRNCLCHPSKTPAHGI